MHTQTLHRFGSWDINPKTDSYLKNLTKLTFPCNWIIFQKYILTSASEN